MVHNMRPSQRPVSQLEIKRKNDNKVHRYLGGDRGTAINSRRVLVLASYSDDSVCGGG